MKKIINYISALALCFSFAQCNDYLATSSPSNTDDQFVTSTPAETFKTLSWCYANFRQNCLPLYRWNDPVGSDAEYYPESGSTNNVNAKMDASKITVNAVMDGFNNLYGTLARATNIANIIAAKPEFQADLKTGSPTAWTQLYGEAVTMRAYCYFELVKHFGDVPYGYENVYVENYTLSSRFDIYDKIIAALQSAEPMMFKLGESGITAERFSKTFCDALIGQIALYAGGYQTIRTDVSGLYGNVQFSTKGKEEFGCIYARRTDYQDYYKIANTYLQKALDNKGSSYLITTDERTTTNNPFQRHFQYCADLKISPEALFEIGNIQGGQSGQTTTSEYPYAFGRPSNGGGTNSAPCKSFGAIRINPCVYYGEFETGDKRRDASITVTGSNGDGNEAMLNFVPGSKLAGGIASNKWDENRMNPPYTAAQRQSGINWPVMRMADVILMLAETKAELGDNTALDLVNQIRTRAFGNSSHNLSGLTGDALKEAVWQERKLEFIGEGIRRWDLIRSGKMAERAVAVRDEFNSMVSGLSANGYYTFGNGNQISSYIYTKMQKLDNPLTYECTDPTNPVLYPGWRGQYNYSTIAAIVSKIKGTDHNVAIQGLFSYINPSGTTASTLVTGGYKKVNWGVDLVTNATVYNSNMLSAVVTADQPPRYYWPMPSETISKSNGKITNGYGLPQQ